MTARVLFPGGSWRSVRRTGAPRDCCRLCSQPPRCTECAVLRHAPPCITNASPCLTRTPLSSLHPIFTCPPPSAPLSVILHPTRAARRAGLIEGLDIGCGTNLIYCLLGAAVYGWRMVGVDVTDVALEWAERHIERNPHLQHLLEVRQPAKVCACVRTCVRPRAYVCALLCAFVCACVCVRVRFLVGTARA